jgi:serine protease Do
MPLEPAYPIYSRLNVEVDTVPDAEPHNGTPDVACIGAMREHLRFRVRDSVPLDTAIDCSRERDITTISKVVVGKPAADPLAYEKPLPLELMPYRERTDKFQSIGTAFAIGPNRFVTAAHVIIAGNGSQYGPVALRNAAGTVYRVDKIIKYSSSEDYAVFSVIAPPLESRASYRIMVMRATDSISLNEKIPLPKTLDEFYAASHLLSANWATKIHADFVKNHADTIFPSGNSEQLLISVLAEAFPKLICLTDSGTWALTGDAPKKVQLDKNGYLQEGTANNVFLMRLNAPDDVSGADLMSDSKKFMDLLLKGYPLSRPVGTDSVRVTSMGSAKEESWFTDDYKRKWQVRTWLVPFNDSAVVTIALPTPDGMVMMMAQVPTSLREVVTKEMQNLCGFFYVSYTGTLAQWQAFLAQPSALPAALSNVQIEFDYNRGIGVRSSRFQMLVPVAVVKIDADSVLMLKFTYMRDAANTQWDLSGVYVADNGQNQNWVGMLRRVKPSPSMPEDFTRLWSSMTTAIHPWDGAAYLTGGRSEINAMVNAKEIVTGKNRVGYTLTLNLEGTQLVNKMKSEFSALERGFKVTE